MAKAVQRLTAPPARRQRPAPSSHYRQVREALRECCTCVLINTPEQGTSKVSSRAAPLRYNAEGLMLDWAD